MYSARLASSSPRPRSCSRSSRLELFEGVLPLHFADRLGQSEIAALYVVAALLVATSAAAAANVRPRPLVAAAVILACAGIALAGAATQVPLWLLALVLAGVGVGLGNTGSIGVLVQAVPIERIVSAMVIWSQIGIAGYLLGPLLGGLVADQLGFAYRTPGRCSSPAARWGSQPGHGLRHSLARNWPIAQSSLIPIAVMFAADILGESDENAILIAGWSCVLILGGWGIIVGRREHESKFRIALTSLGCAALGGVMIGLKVAIH